MSVDPGLRERFNAAYVGELAEHGLSGGAIEALRSNGIATMRDLNVAMTNGTTAAILYDNERIDLIFATWSFMGRALKLNKYDVKARVKP